eukprot:COSAG06_NODE_50_length_28525_cov_88.227010_24_plen_144_part_00
MPSPHARMPLFTTWYALIPGIILCLTGGIRPYAPRQCLTFRHRHGGRVCQSRRLLTAVGRAFLPLNETFAACTEFIRSTRGNIRPPCTVSPIRLDPDYHNVMLGQEVGTSYRNLYSSPPGDYRLTVTWTSSFVILTAAYSINV